MRGSGLRILTRSQEKGDAMRRDTRKLIQDLTSDVRVAFGQGDLAELRQIQKALQEILAEVEEDIAILQGQGTS